MLALTLRLIVSLAIVVGLLLLLARVGARRFRGQAGALVHVVHRQPLSRTTALAVVTVGTRVLVLGTTEQQVSLLTELDPDEVEAALEVPLDLTGAEDPDSGPEPAGTGSGVLSGSVLSATTWRQAFRAATQISRHDRNPGAETALDPPDARRAS